MTPPPSHLPPTSITPLPPAVHPAVGVATRLSQEHKVAVVTGASGGLGRAIATSLAKAGFHLVLHYHRNHEVAEALADGLRNGIQTTTFRADLAKRADAEALVAHAQREFGGVGVLVNNAGMTRDARVHKLTDEDWEETLRTNLTSAFYTTRAALPGMYERRWGRIVNLSSVAGQRPFVGTAPYSTSKAAIEGFTRVVAAEGAGLGVTCNAIAPGLVEAGMGTALRPKAYEAMLAATPMGRPGDASEIGGLVAYLASPAGAFITGQVLAVNGGLHM